MLKDVALQLKSYHESRVGSRRGANSLFAVSTLLSRLFGSRIAPRFKTRWTHEKRRQGCRRGKHECPRHLALIGPQNLFAEANRAGRDFYIFVIANELD